MDDNDTPLHESAIKEMLPTLNILADHSDVEVSCVVICISFAFIIIEISFNFQVLANTVRAIFGLVNTRKKYVIRLVIDSGICSKLVSLLTHPDAKVHQITMWTLLTILDEKQVTAAALGCDGLEQFPILWESFNQEDSRVLII